MDEIIRLSGCMWNAEEAAEKLCKVLAILLFGACLWGAAGYLDGSGADEYGYSAAGSFVYSQAEEGGEGPLTLPKVSGSFFLSVPAPVPVSSIEPDKGIQESAADNRQIRRAVASCKLQRDEQAHKDRRAAARLTPDTVPQREAPHLRERGCGASALPSRRSGRRPNPGRQ